MCNIAKGRLKLLSQAVDSTLGLHVGSMVKWLKRHAYDHHGLGSKPTCTILLCSWEKHFTALSPAWWLVISLLNYKWTAIFDISGSRSG